MVTAQDLYLLVQIWLLTPMLVVPSWTDILAL